MILKGPRNYAAGFIILYFVAGHYISGMSVHPSVLLSVRHTLWVTLHVQRPAKAMPFKQIIMHALHYQDDVDVHLLLYFDIDLHLTCS